LAAFLAVCSLSARAQADTPAPANPPAPAPIVPVSAVPRVGAAATTPDPSAHGGEAPVTKSPDEPELTFKPKSPDYKVALVFDDADLNDVIKSVGEMTGKRFVLASTHAKALKATLFAPEKVSVTEAYQAFLALLQANALTVIPSGPFWKIVDTQDVSKQATPVIRAGEATTAEERYVTRVLRLHHVNAEDIASGVLSKFTTRDGTVVPYAPGNLVILTDTGQNIRRLQRILEDVDVAQPGDKVWLEPLHYVAASDVEKKLAEVFDLKAAGAASATPSADRLTRLVALERPNALMVVGGDVAYARVLSFLERIDIPVTTDGAIHVIPLEHADAKKIVPAINEALQGATQASQGKGGGEPLGVLESAVRVSAEETTNSILVTASEHDFAAVKQVISKLDRTRRQVYIEAVVMDVGVERDTGVGVQYHGIDALDGSGTALYGGMNPFASATQPATAAAGSLSDSTLQALALGVRGPTLTALGMSIPAFGAFIQASTHTLDSDILQTPHILATDNVQAEFHVTVNRSLQQNAASYSALSALTGSTGAAGAATSSLLGTAPAMQNYKALGPQIKITPHLNESDDVRLDIVETISDTTGITEGSLGTLPFTERGATTTLTVHDQQTTVIGGLVADKVSHETVKIPFLGDIPLLGVFFRHTNDGRQKTNLVLVLTPYIIRDQEDMRRIVVRRMEERQELLDHQALFSDHPWNSADAFTKRGGLLAEIRKSEKKVEEERAREAELTPKEIKTHEPTEPLELPVLAGAGPAPAASAPPAKAGGRIER
jgi:general secretion pathway protein D